MRIFSKRPGQDHEMSMGGSIELDDADLLDIDGSDDATVAFANRAARRAVARAAKNLRPAAVRASVKEPEDLRKTNPIERDAEIYPEPPTLIAQELMPRSTPARSPATHQAPAHFWRPRPANTARVRAPSEVSESYPPVAVMTEAQAELKLRPSGSGSRWAWVGAAVIGTLLLIGASVRSAPVVAEHANAASQPPPAAVVDAPPTAADDANVVKFDQDDAVAIKRAAKPAPQAPARRWAAPWKKKSAPAAEKAEKADKAEKPAPAAEKVEKAAPAAKSAEQKELEDLQLKAASR